jgi:putative endonuclease
MAARYLFVVRCADGSLYTAVTNDPAAALGELNAGRGSNYTRTRLPVFLAYSEEYMNEEDAIRRAESLRRLSREEKERLFAEYGPPFPTSIAHAV